MSGSKSGKKTPKQVFIGDSSGDNMKNGKSGKLSQDIKEQEQEDIGPAVPEQLGENKTRMKRVSQIQRKTRETEIDVYLNLDGTGIYNINIDDGFLRHMLETLAKYSGFDIEIASSGDDRHHLIEDVGITLGKALRDALGKDPTARIGHAVVPMDDALVMVSIDIIDRPYMDASLPDKQYSHFLRSFAMESRISLHNVVMKGHDEHHIIEATFKGLGIALKNAVVRVEKVLSTKDNVIIT